MTKAERLSDAMGRIDDRFIYETYVYEPKIIFRKFHFGENAKAIVTIAASFLLLIVGLRVCTAFHANFIINIHEYESNGLVEHGESNMTQSVDDDAVKNILKFGANERQDIIEWKMICKGKRRYNDDVYQFYENPAI